MLREFAVHAPAAALAVCLSLRRRRTGRGADHARRSARAGLGSRRRRPRAPPRRAATVTVTAGRTASRCARRTARSSCALRGGVQYDGRFFADDTADAAINTFALRRVRADFVGTLYSLYEFRLYTDFANSQVELLDAYLDARFSPAVRVRAGKFKVPMGLERLQSAWVVLFPERGYPTALVANRDVGVQVHGVVGDGVLEYAAGVFNGGVDGGNQDLDAGDGKDVVGRVFVQPFARTAGPFRGLGLGIAASTGTQEGSAATPAAPPVPHAAGARPSPATAPTARRPAPPWRTGAARAWPRRATGTWAPWA